MKNKKLDMIRAKRPDLLQGKDEAVLTDQEIDTLARMAELSLDDIRDLLRQAVHERFDDVGRGTVDAPAYSSYLQEVYPAYLIYELKSKYYKIGWSILDGKVTLGETPTEVEQQYVEVRSVQAEMGDEDGVGLMMRLGAAQNPEGTAWEVTVCEPGHTLNGWFIQEAALQAAVDQGLFENSDINIYELPGQGATHIHGPLTDVKDLLVKNKAGWLDNCRYVAGVGMKGVVHFLDSFKQLGKNMLQAKDAGAPIYGLSWDAGVCAKKEAVDGRVCMNIYKFNRIIGVDIVTRPAAGGKFNRAVADVPAQNEEETMKKRLIATIKKKRPDLLTGKDEAALTDQEVETLASMAMDAPDKGKNVDTENLVTKDELKIFQCEQRLSARLSDPDIGLPRVAMDRVRSAFSGKAFEDAALDKAIADEKEYLAKIAPQPEGVMIVGAGNITGGLGSFERACMAADRLFGLKKEDMVNMAKLLRLDNKPFFEDVRSVQDYNDYDSVPAFTSIREMYTFFTGDQEVSGRFNRKALAPELRASMDINSSTFSYVLGNTLGRRLVGVYKAMAYLEELLISVKKSVKDFRAQEAVLVGGFPDLASVNPESGDFQEIAGVTDEESTYTVAAKGNILTITRKIIVNDDISIIQRLIDGLGRAARRTHAKYVWALFTANANCSDGTAWFTGGHGNLGSTALSHAQALIAYKALAKMTEKDSGERLGLLSDPSVKPNLVGPIDLMETIGSIANDEYYYTSNDLTTKTTNPLKGKVNGVAVPLFTDTNNWGLLLPPEIADMVEMGYLNGRAEPELFVADSPQSEQVFVADKIRHKIRHEYAGAVIDYRTGFGAIVA